MIQNECLDAPAIELRPEASSTHSEMRYALFGSAAVLAMSRAMQLSDGMYSALALRYITLAILLLALPLLWPKFARQSEIVAGRRGTIAVVALALFVELAMLFAHRGDLHLNWEQPPRELIGVNLPGSWHGPVADRWFYVLLVAATVPAALIALTPPKAARPLFWVSAIAFAGLGSWLIHRCPVPRSDVWIVQTECVRYWRETGGNPYTAAFPDRYNALGTYAPGSLRDGLVHQGFPYPPLVFWMNSAGQYFGGDFRWINLAAMLGAAALIAHMRPGRLAPLAGLLLLFTPRTLFVLEAGWTEPQSALFLAAAVFAACRAKRSFPIAVGVTFGLFLASKQYLVFAVPLSILLMPRSAEGLHPNWRLSLLTMLIAATTAGAISLPMALHDWHAFRYATYDIAAAAGFGRDSLTYWAALFRWKHFVPGAPLAMLTGLLLAGAASVLALVRLPRCPAAFAFALGLVYLLFFAFNKFACCNYYYYAAASLCCAAGAVAQEAKCNYKCSVTLTNEGATGRA